uniref:RUN domain-containing protein n=1 Tax=Clastoptera arizonana TaxID=38151 RepID=A0A1B6C9V8_9HEMI
MMDSMLKSIVKVQVGSNLVKSSLRSRLVASVKDVLLEFTQEFKDLNNINDASNSLCVVLEAIFIHGLKETFADKMAIALADPDQRPEPNFWPPLLIFSHRQIINQISELLLITTDVGRCRVWIRLALNECLLSSYLQSMILQNDAFKPYYKPTAYLRDTELLDVTKQLIKGIETCEFDFSCNSSLLNVWTNSPLLMAGIWSPPMKSLPVTSGTDVANSLLCEDNMRIDDSISVASSYVSYQDSLPSSSQSVLFDEEEALKAVLDLKMNDDNKSETPISVKPYKDVAECPQAEESPFTGLPIISESNFENLKDSSSEEQEDSQPIENNVESDKENIVSSEISPNVPKLSSYHSLVENYNQDSTVKKYPIDLNDIIKRFQKIGSSKIVTTNNNEQVAEGGFEVLTSGSEEFNEQEYCYVTGRLGTLPVELGLDEQKYKCKDCSNYIGIYFHHPGRVCSLTGSYYCDNCFYHSRPSKEWVIPARIVQNWDFRRHPVSNKAAEFLNQIQHHPVMNINVMNPRLYRAIEEMSDLQDLRIRLNYLRAYLEVCKTPILEEMTKKMWPREYLFRFIHIYSISDLIEVPSGVLKQQLEDWITDATKHVTSCWMCRQKGFICEICRHLEIIYPFDTAGTKKMYYMQCIVPYYVS